MMRQLELLTVCISLLCLSLSASQEEDETSRVCTFPSVACYEGSVLKSDQGNRYLSFQGIR